MEYDDSQTARDLGDRARQFVDEAVLPTKREYLGDGPVPRDVVDVLREEARIPVSMCKVFAANTTQETIDFAVQACGANGIGRDLPLADFYEAVRAFRIVDGADEVHKRVIARDAFEEVGDPALDNTPVF